MRLRLLFTFLLALVLTVQAHRASAGIEYFYLKVCRDGKTLELRQENEAGEVLGKTRFRSNEDPAAISEKIAPTGIFNKRIWVYFHCMWGNNSIFQRMTLGYVKDIADNGQDNILLSVVWPANKVGYQRNWKKANLKGQRLERFFRCMARHQKGGINILSHSMGNRVFQGLWQKAGDTLLFENVVLAAPDLDTDVFATDFSNLSSRTKQIVLVRHNNDRMLLASSVVHRRARLGRAKHLHTPPPNLVLVDATPHASLRGIEMSNHLHFIFAEAVRAQVKALTR